MLSLVAGLLLSAATVLGFAVACGGDDQRGPAATVPAASTKAYTAEQLIPNLDDLGIKISEKQADPLAVLANQDSFRALYTGKYSVQVVVTVFKDEAAARTQFDNMAVALRNPPPEFVGAGVPQADLPAVVGGGQSKAYVTSKPDNNKLLVWTDVTQFGRAVAIVQVLGRDGGDVTSLRTTIAERIAAGTK